MPVGIIAKGGPTYLSHVSQLSAHEATEALQAIKSHLSQPGRASGVLTLASRTQQGREMELVRKNRFQLMFRGEGNTRLNDTKAAIDTLLRTAGLHDAADELQHYLSAKPGEANRISARKMLEVLRAHLRDTEFKGDGANPQPAEDAREQAIEPPVREAQHVQIQESEPQQPPPLQPGVPPSSDSHHTGEWLRATSFDDLLSQAGLKQVRVLGQGASGKAEEVTLHGESEPLVLKTFYKVDRITKEVTQDAPPISLNRHKILNEAIAAYLTSKKDATYADRVGVAQPKYFLVWVNEGDHRMVDALGLRALLKAHAGVQCTGLIIPKAPGDDMRSLMERQRMTPQQSRGVIKSILQTVKTLDSRGLRHRDIKPENIMYDPNSGQTTLIDTGFMHKVSKNDPSTRYPSKKYILGTPQYMHGRIIGGLDHGTEADLHAVGVMAMELEHPEAVDYLVTVLYDFANRDPDLFDEDNANLFKKVNLETLLFVIEDEAKYDPLLKALIPKLEALMAALQDPRSLASFGMRCIDQANLPASTWADRQESQRLYEELLADPRLNA